MKIDEAVFESVFGTWPCAPHSTEKDDARAIVERYLAAIPAEPEIKGGVRVRILVAVSESGEWFAHSFSDGTRADFEEVICMSYDEPQFRWIEATVPPYAPPAEPVVEGVVVE